MSCLRSRRPSPDSCPLGSAERGRFGPVDLAQWAAATRRLGRGGRCWSQPGAGADGLLALLEPSLERRRLTDRERATLCQLAGKLRLLAQRPAESAAYSRGGGREGSAVESEWVVAQG